MFANNIRHMSRTFNWHLLYVCRFRRLAFNWSRYLICVQGWFVVCKRTIKRVGIRYGIVVVGYVLLFTSSQVSHKRVKGRSGRGRSGHSRHKSQKVGNTLRSTRRTAWSTAGSGRQRVVVHRVVRWCHEWTVIQRIQATWIVAKVWPVQLLLRRLGYLRHWRSTTQLIITVNGVSKFDQFLNKLVFGWWGNIQLDHLVHKMIRQCERFVKLLECAQTKTEKKESTFKGFVDRKNGHPNNTKQRQALTLTNLSCQLAIYIAQSMLF